MEEELDMELLKLSGKKGQEYEEQFGEGSLESIPFFYDPVHPTNKDLREYIQALDKALKEDKPIEPLDAGDDEGEKAEIIY